MNIIDVRKCPECGTVAYLEKDYYSCANCSWIVHKNDVKVLFTKLDMIRFAEFYEDKIYNSNSNGIVEEFNNWLKNVGQSDK
jgi:hypothetical protein